MERLLTEYQEQAKQMVHDKFEAKVKGGLYWSSEWTLFLKLIEIRSWMLESLNPNS